MNSLVSIIVPTCNRQDFLVRAIKSIDQQTYDNIEIIVVDDFSDDPVSIDLMKKYTSRPLKIIRNNERKGGGASRNIGIEISKGEYFCFLDDDDEYYIKKVENLLKFLLENNYDAVFGKVTLKDEEKIVDRFEIPTKIDKNLNIMLMNVIHNNATLISKKCKIRFYEELTRYQDMQFNLELWCKYNVGFFNEPVAVWYVEERKDKITNSSGIEKQKRDLNAFIFLYEYLIKNLNFSSYYLTPYTMKLIKDAYSILLFKDFFKVLIGSKFSLKGFVVSIFYRKKYFK